MAEHDLSVVVDQIVVIVEDDFLVERIVDVGRSRAAVLGGTTFGRDEAVEQVGHEKEEKEQEEQADE